jgi:hypothetical protein
MALSDANKVLLYEVFGVPMAGEGYEAQHITSLYGPFSETYDFSTIVTDLDTRLAAMTSAQEDRIEALLSEASTIKTHSVVRVDRDPSGAQGRIVDHEREQEKIRRALGTVIGFYVPRGGYMMECDVRRSTYINPGPGLVR